MIKYFLTLKPYHQGLIPSDHPLKITFLCHSSVSFKLLQQHLLSIKFLITR
eukprot:c11390_g1_i1 orf=3-152(-)